MSSSEYRDVTTTSLLAELETAKAGATTYTEEEMAVMLERFERLTQQLEEAYEADGRLVPDDVRKPE